MVEKMSVTELGNYCRDYLMGSCRRSKCKFDHGIPGAIKSFRSKQAAEASSGPAATPGKQAAVPPSATAPPKVIAAAPRQVVDPFAPVTFSQLIAQQGGAKQQGPSHVPIGRLGTGSAAGMVTAWLFDQDDRSGILAQDQLAKLAALGDTPVVSIAFLGAPGCGKSQYLADLHSIMANSDSSIRSSSSIARQNLKNELQSKSGSAAPSAAIVARAQPMQSGPACAGTLLASIDSAAIRGVGSGMLRRDPGAVFACTCDVICWFLRWKDVVALGTPGGGIPATAAKLKDMCRTLLAQRPVLPTEESGASMEVSWNHPTIMVVVSLSMSTEVEALAAVADIPKYEGWQNRLLAFIEAPDGVTTDMGETVTAENPLGIDFVCTSFNDNDRMELVRTLYRDGLRPVLTGATLRRGNTMRQFVGQLRDAWEEAGGAV